MQSKLFQAIEPAQVADLVRAGIEALGQMEESTWRAGDDPDTYEPSVAKLIPIASIRLRTDDNDIYMFQCDRQMLEFLITRLGATLKELEVLGKVRRGA